MNASGHMVLHQLRIHELILSSATIQESHRHGVLPARVPKQADVKHKEMLSLFRLGMNGIESHLCKAVQIDMQKRRFPCGIANVSLRLLIDLLKF